MSLVRIINLGEGLIVFKPILANMTYKRSNFLFSFILIYKQGLILTGVDHEDRTLFERRGNSLSGQH
jgi:hypothetical protein